MSTRKPTIDDLDDIEEVIHGSDPALPGSVNPDELDEEEV